MPKKIPKIGYPKKAEIDPLVRASMALKRLIKAAEKIDAKGLPKIQEKFSNILHDVIKDIDARFAPYVECLKLCAKIKDDSSAIQVFNKLQPPELDKLRTFVRTAKGLTRGERLYLHGVLRRHAAYFDGTLEAEIQALHDEGKHRAGLALIRKWLAKVPEDDRLFIREGLCLSALERHREAIAAFDRAIVLDAGIYAWWVFRGNAYAALSEYEQAIHDYGISLAIDPENWSVYDKMGHCYFYSGETARGIALTEYAFEQGRVPDTALILILMLEQSGMRDRALQQAQARAKEFPQDKRFLEAITRIKLK